MDAKSRTFPQAVALNSDFAAMQFDQLLDDSQSESKSTMPAGGRRIPLLKAVENVRQELGCDALASINYADLDFCAGVFEQYLDFPILGSELDGVVQKVPENLLQAIRIPGDRSGKGVQPGL